MSDLQCAARFFLVAEGPSGQAEAQLRRERVAALVGDPAGATADLAEALTAGRVDVRRDLVDAEALAGVLETLADSYRGESVVVVAGGEVIDASLSKAVQPLPPRALAPGEVARVDVDADGWALRSWAGEPV